MKPDAAEPDPGLPPRLDELPPLPQAAGSAVDAAAPRAAGPAGRLQRVPPRVPRAAVPAAGAQQSVIGRVETI